MIFCKDKNDIVTLTNRAFANALKLRKEDIIGKTTFDLFPKNQAEHYRKDDLNVINSGIPKLNIEESADFPTGRIWAITSKIPYLNENGVVEGTIGLAIDITERKRIEERLKESEEKFRTIAEESMVGINIIQDDTFKYINQKLLDFHGFTHEEINNWKPGDIYNLIHPDQKELVKELTLKMQSGKLTSSVNTELKLIRNPGEIMWLNLFGKSILYQGRPAAMTISVDITERKKIEQKLKESEEKYRFLINNINDLLVEVDLYGNITFISPQSYQILGYKPEELIGKNAQEILHPDESMFKRDHLESTLKSREPLIQEHRIRHKMGYYVYFSIQGNIAQIDGNIKLIGIFRDISELKKTEQKLKESEQKYREAYDREMIYRDIFVHDFNNILQNIQSSSDLCAIYLEKPSTKNQIKELNDIIEGQVFRGTKLINNVRKISQIEESNFIIGQIELNRVLNDSIEYIKKSFQKKSIKIEIVSPRREIYVHANEFLSDVFENIFINAVKYCENPVCEMSIKVSKYQENKMQYVKIEVVDNGIGIPEEIKPLIFQIGFNIEKRSKGMGFGLSIVKKIIDRFDGKITVENRVKGDHTQGSNFILLLIETKKN